MKNLLFSLFTLAFFSSFADSIETKLKQYKQLYDDSLISPTEYQKLKNDILFNPITQIQSNVATFNPSRYGRKTTPGAIFMSLGLTALSGGLYCRYKTIPDFRLFVDKHGNVDVVGLEKAAKRYKARYYTPVITGSVSSALGIILLAIGLKERHLFLYNDNLSIGLSQQGLGVSFIF